MTNVHFEKETMECIPKGLLCKGIYVFQCKETNDILYVGKADTQLLAKRFSQNFATKDSGGNFRINWQGKNCDQDITSECFDRFRNVLTRCRIRLICIDDLSGANEVTNIKEIVHELESAILYKLCQRNNYPKYNKEKPRWTPKFISEECIGELVSYIEGNTN